MASKFFRAFNTIRKKLPRNKSKVAPTITQPRQLKTTMKRIQSENKKFGFTEAKTATDRANIVRTKKSIERMDKLNKAKDKRKEGIKASKEIKKMVGTGQADRVGGSVYHRGVREKKAMGGVTGAIDKLKGKARGQQGQKRKDKNKFPDGLIIVVPDGKGGKKQIVAPRDKKLFGGRIKKKKPETEKQKSIKEKILPKKKKDRLNELRKELGLKKGGSALKPVDKEKNPGLAKLPTQVRNKMGYMKKGGQVRKFGGGKK